MTDQRFASFFCCLATLAALAAGCSARSSITNAASTTLTRTLNADTSYSSIATTTDVVYPTNPGSNDDASSTKSRTCYQETLNTSSCQSSREALGITDARWLAFSCNVVEGLATSSFAATTSYSAATYITLASTDMPDYGTNYYATSGSYDFTAYGYAVEGLFDSLYAAYTTAFPDPNTIAQKSMELYIPINPTAVGEETTAQQMSMGVVGLAINGVALYDSVAGGTDNIFAESGSFDGCGGHADEGSYYHYHGEPYALSYNDYNLIGVMRDGYFVWGRNDNPTYVVSGYTEPGSVTNVGTIITGTSSTALLYIYGGHIGYDPYDNYGFHYHLTEWQGCYDQSANNSTYYVDNGETNDNNNQPLVITPTCDGTTSTDSIWVDGWFVTGHGNGGVFETPSNIGTGGSYPSWNGGASNDQEPSQTVPAERYYYGLAPSQCPGCG